MRDRRLPDGRERVVRHGLGPEREIQTGIGPVAVRRPRVRDRGDGRGGEPTRFTSKVLPPFPRRTRNVEELLPWLYSKGISTGQFEEASAVLLGPDAPGLSAATVRRLVADWQEEAERWQRRDLGARRYVHLWADGVCFTPRLEQERPCVLVLIGADADGRKELLALEDGYRESAQSWRELLLRLRDENGLAAPPALELASLVVAQAGRAMVERLVGRLKEYRRVATRYDKLATSYLAFVQLAAIRIWL